LVVFSPESRSGRCGATLPSPKRGQRRTPPSRSHGCFAIPELRALVVVVIIIKARRG
jgi:hypothetical protein